MIPQNHLALTYVSSKQQSLSVWGISGMQDNAVRCDGCAIKSACVAPVALGEQILELVREANRQGSESCRPRRASLPPSLGWGVGETTHGPAFLRRGAEPTSSVLATHAKERKRQRKERKKKKKRPQLQPRFSNKNQQEQNSSVDQSSPERIDNNNEIGVLEAPH